MLSLPPSLARSRARACLVLQYLNRALKKLNAEKNDGVPQTRFGDWPGAGTRVH